MVSRRCGRRDARGCGRLGWGPEVAPRQAPRRVAFGVGSMLLSQGLGVRPAAIQDRGRPSVGFVALHRDQRGRDERLVSSSRPPRRVGVQSGDGARRGRAGLSVCQTLTVEHSDWFRLLALRTAPSSAGRDLAPGPVVVVVAAAGRRLDLARPRGGEKILGGVCALSHEQHAAHSAPSGGLGRRWRACRSRSNHPPGARRSPTTSDSATGRRAASDRRGEGAGRAPGEVLGRWRAATDGCMEVPGERETTTRVRGEEVGASSRGGRSRRPLRRWGRSCGRIGAGRCHRRDHHAGTRWRAPPTEPPGRVRTPPRGIVGVPPASEARCGGLVCRPEKVGTPAAVRLALAKPPRASGFRLSPIASASPLRNVNPVDRLDTSRTDWEASAPVAHPACMRRAR